MQHLVHPGPKTVPRIIPRHVRTRQTICKLSVDQPVIDQLHASLRSMGATHGFAELHGGELGPLSYCVPDVATAEKALSFSASRTHDSAHLIYGSFTLGEREGTTYMHSHSFWQAPTGVLEGGHVWLETKVGEHPPMAIVTAVFDAKWVSTNDPETLMPVFTPEPLQADPDGSNLMQLLTDLLHNDDNNYTRADTVIARVLPNMDITEALLQVCEQAGYQRATVRAGLGSFVGATFIDRASGEIRTIDGPATEVIALIGDVVTVDGARQTRLSCTLVDRHGVIHAGELVPGENLVAATFELTVQRIDAQVITIF